MKDGSSREQGVSRRGGGSGPRRLFPEETQQALEQAALSLLDRDGVLAGLNLQEVAEKAGVNRSLVYHHYGSRQELLRAALRPEARSFVREVAEDLQLSYPDRMVRFFWATVRYARAVRLSVLLMLDRDDHVKTMPLRNETNANIRRGVEDGVIRPDVDIEAFHAVLVAGIYGYGLYRKSFAKEMGVPVSQLDRRAGEVVEKLLDTIRGNRPAARSDGPDGPPGAQGTSRE